ncbi:helix-turn-helix transcriptional regulator [Pseudorhodoplanes sp.]|uniref:helix-turn-helix domain-containing protein n=1 Tax=Pseudorhodoplanes sp. TaxID=1934341 RepID=UPI002C816757|nr:helix-turn-helix transcriptional regulator [Pseudorhodoplanes sp.]HWV53850.1 helix-turn-helix transcriptional regulator [Pseudorhodoplanes sp.]
MTKLPNTVDAQIGARVRMHRLLADMTQEQLGAALGVTFQQIQKYEKGVNRIGAGRLQDIANTLRVPVSAFFADTQDTQSISPDGSGSDITDFISSGDGLALARSFVRISDSNLRRRVVSLVEELSSSHGTPAQ